MQTQNQVFARQSEQRYAPMPVLPEEHKLVAMAKSRGWTFNVLGVAPIPVTPVFVNNWWLVPVAADHSTIPAQSLERVRAIYEAGIRPKAFVMAHESPKLLPAPASAPKGSRREFWQMYLRRKLGSLAKLTGKVLALTAVILLVVTIALGALFFLAAVAASALLVLGLAGAVALDPCLIAITDDNVWIEIDSWVDSEA